MTPLQWLAYSLFISCSGMQSIRHEQIELRLLRNENKNKKVHRFDNIGGRVYCFRSTTLRAGIIVVWKCLNHIVRYSRTEYGKGMGVGGDSRSYESRFHEICSCSENFAVRFRYFEFITFAMSSMLYILLFCFTLYCRFAA